MGEEYRRGWHPERVNGKQSESEILVVGAGPAGLECAVTLGKRGYRVRLAEAERELGGRALVESRLPGLAAWVRVRDHRVQQLSKLPTVEIFRESRLDAADIAELAPDHVVIATGCRWRKDGVGRRNHRPVPDWESTLVFSPEEVMAGCRLSDPVILFDDDEYYLGGVLAEKLRRDGHRVVLVTPAALVSAWTQYTLEQEKIQKRLIELDVEIVANHNLAHIGEGRVELACVFTDRPLRREAGSVVMVTSRAPSDDLYRDLTADAEKLAAIGITSVSRIGDCLAPGMIAHAVYSGHRYARELDAPATDALSFRPEPVDLTLP
jgi:dimethylamine/trimethylamine dehydrogenase